MSSGKAVERAELHKTIWRLANELRGSVDGWDFKSYVLGILFYRFISENLTAYLNAAEREAGDPTFEYAALSAKQAEAGRKDVVAEKGFFILPDDLFASVRARARQDHNLNETLARVFANIESSAHGTPSERDFKGLFDDLDVNSNKLGPTVAKRNQKLVKLLEAIGDLPLNGTFDKNTNDLFGDAYEYLMGMYASTAGKSGGEYYTPQEVSELLARIAVAGRTEVNKVYDPACGSGALLLKFAKVLGPQNVRRGFYGQEINLTTYNLARINMFLHDVPYEKFDIAHGDTLVDPAHWDDEPFQAIVSNPPYSLSWVGDADITLINDERYAPAGVLAPRNRADMAFVMHMLHWLAVDGTAAIVEFPGVLYRSGAERKIRQYLVANNYVDAIIQLPRDLFFGTTIETCVIVLKKSKSTSDIAFIDASGEFVRHGNKNVLSPANQLRILDALERREEVPHFVRVVPNDTVLAQQAKLAVPLWVEEAGTRPSVDLGELKGALDDAVARQSALREQIATVVAEIEKLEHDHGAPRRALGEIGTFKRGRRFTKADLVEEGIPAVHYADIYTRHGISASEATSFVTQEFSGTLAYAQPGDVIMASVGETVEDVGRAVAWLGESDVAIHDDTFAYRSEHLRPAFVAYFMRSETCKQQKLRHVARAKVKRIGASGLSQIEIPVPSLNQQDRIVELLGEFEKLVERASAALFDEAKARARQAEQYRNALLSFGSRTSSKAGT